MKLELKYTTPIGWAENAVKDIDSFLQDHADAERKVANMCLSLIAKYPNRVKSIDELIKGVSAKSFTKVTLGSCFIDQINETILISKES